MTIKIKIIKIWILVWSKGNL